MSLLVRSLPMPGAGQLIPSRTRKVGAVNVNSETSLRHSGVWACLRLRADLVSTMPVDTYRRVDGKQVETPKPKVLVNPAGERVDITEWMYSTQVDLDRFGNCFGLITERDGQQLPARIDLVSAADATVIVRNGELVGFRLGGKEYDATPWQRGGPVWHEKQFTVAGLPVGLSPVSYAAWTIGGYLSAQEFALDWFGNGATPSGHFKNTAKTINNDQADEIKARFTTAIGNRQPLVTGNDWEYNLFSVPANESQFLETQKAGLGDVCRYFGVPGDMIDVEGGTSTITYANVTQRNLQLLILNLGPAVNRRERALSTLLPAPRYVKLNSDAAVLRMDPLTRAQMGKTQVDGRLRAPSELREKDDLPPFTEEQFLEFERLFARRTQTSTTGEVIPP